MNPLRWTPLVFALPRLYVEKNSMWRTFDFEAWSRDDYTWVQDGWNGLRDIARPPYETVIHGEGDCEDYALVAASVCLSRSESPRLACFFDGLAPSHVVCYSDDAVYSSGDILHDTSLNEYCNQSKYDYYIARKIRS